MNYTKGEWKISNRGLDIYAPDKPGRPDNVICHLTHLTQKAEEVEANANLIAAAPDMYEALGIMREQVANLINPKIKLLSSRQQIEMMDKALAKAEGKEQK